jgi:CBS domain-containing protein
MQTPWHGQVIAVEQEGKLRAFVALDDLERLTAEDDSDARGILTVFRRAYEDWQKRGSGKGVYALKSADSEPN